MMPMASDARPRQGSISVAVPSTNTNVLNALRLNHETRRCIGRVGLSQTTSFEFWFVHVPFA